VPLIDQRILIAAAADTIWMYLTKPDYVTRWHLGCKQLSMLTTHTQGVGARRRCTDKRGKSIVEEITAWIENIGYEYKVVDGPYRAFRARFRLQPAPEGTIVNWVVEYRRRGAFSGLREAFGGRRRTETRMVESLRALRKLVERSGARLDPERQARVAMQAAPDAAARAARGAEVIRTQELLAQQAKPLVIGEDDLPEPPTSAATLVHQPQLAADPSFVSKLSAVEMPAVAVPPASSAQADTKPRKPKGLAETLQQKPTPKPARPTEDDFAWDSSARTVPISLVAPPPAPAEPTQALEATPPKPTPPPRTLPEIAPTPAAGLPLPKVPVREGDTPPAKPTAALPNREKAASDALAAVEQNTPAAHPEAADESAKPTTIYDTGEVSIWDVFGVPRPSEKTRTDLHAIVASFSTPSEQNRPPEVESAPSATAAPERVQHPPRRLTLRRKAHLRVRQLPAASDRVKARLAQRSRLKVR
jgi:hypothetical protein